MTIRSRWKGDLFFFFYCILVTICNSETGLYSEEIHTFKTFKLGLIIARLFCICMVTFVVILRLTPCRGAREAKKKKLHERLLILAKGSFSRPSAASWLL